MSRYFSRSAENYTIPTLRFPFDGFRRPVTPHYRYQVRRASSGADDKPPVQQQLSLPSPLASTASLPLRGRAGEPDPCVDTPGVVPQPAQLAPPRNCYVHVRDVRAVLDERACVRIAAPRERQWRRSPVLGRPLSERVASIDDDLGVGMKLTVSQGYGVSAMPMFGFVLDEEEVCRLEYLSSIFFDFLTTRIAEPPISYRLNPFLFEVPTLDTARDKLLSFIEKLPSNDYVEKFKTSPSSVVVTAFGRATGNSRAGWPIFRLPPRSRSLDVWRRTRANDRPGHAGPIRQSVDLWIRFIVTPGDTPPASATGGQRPRHIAFLITPGQRRSGEGRSHWRLRAWHSMLALGLQKGRIGRIKGNDAVDGIRVGEEDGEWEVELVSAVVETPGVEEESKDAGE
ncbi:hypothetical protein BC826DRAFT_1102286 [Russula brevipes]|nr:hypothetical protein BC826DRAFT_1102286 [Russula brevipes]